MYPQKVPAVVPGTVHWFWSEIANFLVPGLKLRKILLPVLLRSKNPKTKERARFSMAQSEREVIQSNLHCTFKYM